MTKFVQQPTPTRARHISVTMEGVNFNKIIIVLRCVALILLLLAMACSALGGGCNKPIPSYTPEPDDDATPTPRPSTSTGCKMFHIRYWRTWSPPDDDPGRGRYVIFVIELIYTFITFGLIFKRACKPSGSKKVEYGLLLIGAALLFMCFCLEVWYSNGFGHPDLSIDAWAGAATALFFATSLYVVDWLLLCIKVKDYSSM